MVRQRGYCGYEIWKGEFERISHGSKALRDTTAMTAEREALRMGVEHLMTLFPVEAKDFQFVVENESRETKYKVDTQSLRLIGLRNDHAEDVHRADANRLEEKMPAMPARGGKWEPRFHPGVFVGMLNSSSEAAGHRARDGDQDTLSEYQENP